MGRSASLPALIAAALAGCATVEPSPIPPSLERIVYQRNAALICSDPCQVRIVTVAADGRAWVETGHWVDRENWRIEDREMVRVGSDAYDRLRDLLAPYRPEGDGPSSPPECVEWAYDVGTANVTWVDGPGSVERLVDFGCEGDQPIGEALAEIELLLAPSH